MSDTNACCFEPGLGSCILFIARRCSCVVADTGGVEVQLSVMVLRPPMCMHSRLFATYSSDLLMLHTLIAVQGARDWLGGTDAVVVEEDATNP